VTRTINGRIAWDLLQEWKETAARENRPITDYVHILVSDIEMPAMDGHSLTRKVKEDPVLKRLPVILFSSLITDSLRHKGRPWAPTTRYPSRKCCSWPNEPGRWPGTA
jgi:two-component system chemotaxis response regulator CheV